MYRGTFLGGLRRSFAIDALPEQTGVIVVGAGFAGAATAWALTRAGCRAGLILEREPTLGAHASGRNAGLARQVESDPVILALSARSLSHIRRLEREPGELLRPTGSLTVASGHAATSLLQDHEICRQADVLTRFMSAREVRARFRFLERLQFEAALWCPGDGVMDIHALLVRYVKLASGFTLCGGCAADELLIAGGRVVGVRCGTSEVRADAVVDACGAWAGQLSREPSPLPIQPLRRHLFVSGPLDYVERDWPFTWSLDGPFYFRPEGDGLLLSPCDETLCPPGLPPADPSAVHLLAEKLSHHAPGLMDVSVRRTWACLRTFVPDRRPVIGPDAVLPGLFHASALGGFGMTASAAVGELAANILTSTRSDWIDPELVAPVRFGGTAKLAVR